MKVRLQLKFHSEWEESRKRTLLSLLEFNPHSKVVDLGCGNGKFSIKVKEKIGCEKIFGGDISEKALKDAKKRKVIVKKADLNHTLPLKTESFDVVVSSQVIEHLFYPVKFMKDIHRILKPNGYAVISTENLASWDNISALFFGYTPFSMEFDAGLWKIGNPFSPHERIIVNKYTHPHVRVFAWNGLITLVSILKFKVERVSGSGHILGHVGEVLDKTHCRFIVIKVRK